MSLQEDGLRRQQSYPIHPCSRPSSDSPQAFFPVIRSLNRRAPPEGLYGEVIYLLHSSQQDKAHHPQTTPQHASIEFGIPDDRLLTLPRLVA